MIDETTAHELAAKLHSANGRISRAKDWQDSRESVAADHLNDAQAIIGEVIISLCKPTEPDAFYAEHHTMPVIPPAHPPVDPALAYEEDTA